MFNLFAKSPYFQYHSLQTRERSEAYSYTSIHKLPEYMQ